MSTAPCVIVVAWVPDPAGQAALEAVIAEATLRGGCRLVVINATRGTATLDPRFADSTAVEQARERLAASGLEHDLRQPVGEDVADLVLGAAEETGAGLIVVGLRRRTPVGKLLLGSVSQRLLLEAGVPVLAVKP